MRSRYQRTNGTQEEWHRDIAAFIAQLDNDPELKGKILYRCMKIRDGADYFHLAAGGEVTVSPLEISAETA